MKINRYKRIRLTLALSLDEFSQKSKIGKNTWVRLEREDNSKLYAKTINKLVNNLNVNLEYLLGFSDKIFND